MIGLNASPPLPHTHLLSTRVTFSILFIGRGRHRVWLSIFPFLAPLPCVSRSHGSGFIRCLSSSSAARRPCPNFLRTYCVDFFQTPVVACPGPYVQTFLELKKKGFYNRTLWEQKLQNTIPFSNHF